MVLIAEFDLPPIQQRMMRILEDMRPHTRQELHAECGPSGAGTVRVHLTNMRKKIGHKYFITCRIQKNPQSEFDKIGYESCTVWYQLTLVNPK